LSSTLPTDPAPAVQMTDFVYFPTPWVLELAQASVVRFGGAEVTAFLGNSYAGLPDAQVLTNIRRKNDASLGASIHPELLHRACLCPAAAYSGRSCLSSSSAHSPTAWRHEVRGCITAWRHASF